MNLSLWIVGIVSAAVGIGYFCPLFWQRVERWHLRAKCRDRRALVLTYDDGPSDELTPRLLRVLRSHGAKATFFLAGRHVAVRPNLVDMIVADGHEIGCHAHDHLNAWRSWPWKAVVDVERGYEILSRWLPADGVFRPPHGKVTLPTWLAVRRRGARFGWWTIESGDTYAELPEPQMAARCLERTGGGIVLMHDFDRGPERADFVLKTTEVLLEMAARQHFKVCRLGDLLKNGAHR